MSRQYGDRYDEAWMYLTESAEDRPDSIFARCWRTVQAEVARLREGLPEVSCPSCASTIRARMADAVPAPVSGLERRELAAYRQAVSLLTGCNFIQAQDSVSCTAAEAPTVALIRVMTNYINRNMILEDLLEANDIEFDA